MVINRFDGEYAFLSNFHPLPNGDGITTEHLYQAQKTNDPEWQMRILMANTPGQAKRLGRQCPMRPDWTERRLRVMYDLLVEKFCIPELRAKLLATGKAILIEGNTWGDTFWGICNGVGSNWLGLMLMDIRAKIRLGVM